MKKLVCFILVLALLFAAPTAWAAPDSAEQSPTESAEQSPSETPEQSPTPSLSQSPSETPEQSPTPSPTPSPNETKEPQKGEVPFETSITGCTCSACHYYVKFNKNVSEAWVRYYKSSKCVSEVKANLSKNSFTAKPTVDFDYFIIKYKINGMISYTKQRKKTSCIWKINFNKLMDYSEYEKAVDYLSTNELVTVKKIGESADKRDIHSISIGTGPVRIVVTANVHAREIANTQMILRGVELLLADAKNGAVLPGLDSKGLLSRCTFVIIPLVNPDGREVAIKGSGALRNKNLFIAKQKSAKTLKSNAAGVDLNSNFPLSGVNVRKPSVSRPALEGYHGATTQSETRAVMSVISGTAFDFCADVHSRGRLIYSGKNGKTNNLSDLNAAALYCTKYMSTKRAKFTIIRSEKDVEWQRSVTSYMFTQNIPSMTVETMPSGSAAVPSLSAIEREYVNTQFHYFLNDLGYIVEKYKQGSSFSSSEF